MTGTTNTAGSAANTITGAGFSRSTQRVCVWAGLMMIPAFFLGLGALAHWIPPPAPTTTAAELTAMFEANRGGIRAGLWVTCFGCALLSPYFAVMTVQIRRIEGTRSPLATTQAISAACAVLEFIFPLFAWQAAAYRADRDPALVQLMFDLGWLPFLGIVSTFVVQLVCIAAAILRDPREDPVFPRWGAYLQIFGALGVMGGSFVVFFHDGPLAWNGLIAWWALVVAFFIWMVGTGWLMLNAVSRDDGL
ncbi:MAG TPA: hypothetical protein VL595_17490 [Pseudonocardia sp.]|jgi:hypothetical protein|nr:hypothetical protein [Pseudonocardia sp.]